MIRQVFKQFNLGVTHEKSVAQKLQNGKVLAWTRILNGFPIRLDAKIQPLHFVA